MSNHRNSRRAHANAARSEPTEPTVRAPAKVSKPAKPAKSVGPPRTAAQTATRPQGESPAGDWAPIYLEELAATGYYVASANKCGKHFSTVARRRVSDAEFAVAEQAAVRIAQSIYEDELRRRAIEGIEKNRFDRAGNLLQTERVYSDGLLLRLLEKLDPAWRAKQEIQHSGAMTFGTRAERMKKLEEARTAAAAPLS